MDIVHTLLVKCRDARAEDAGLVAEFDRCRLAMGPGAAVIGLYRGLRTPDVHVHCELARETSAADLGVTALREALQSCSANIAVPVTIDRLQRVQDVPGASRGATPRFRYVVETDVADGWEGELDRWYATEHLPGLALVAGCTRAQRFLNRDAGPRSVACYDLVAPEVIGSPAWLAVRRPPWSERVRPQFRDTRRTVFRTVAVN